MKKNGTIVCVGTGMMLGAHISPRSRSHIEQADVVFVAVSDPVVELWLREMNSDVRSLQPYYTEGKSRHETYREMVEGMMVEVRSGKQVCGAFYGHPGVFAFAPHKVIEQARSEGFLGHMEPGISAEDCLYADLGIDPGRFGCQHYEASQFMFYQRVIDPSAYLVLWQVGIAGDRSFRRYSTETAYRQLLVDLLVEHYPLEHEIIVYEAATLPIGKPRMQKMALSELVKTELYLQSTLVLPPGRVMLRNETMLNRIEALERMLNSSPTAVFTQ
ncbi:MAG: SAM-dependent methyltransferase, partial [Arenimonas sp.]